MSNSIINLFLLAFFTETIWEIIKKVIPGYIKKPDWVDVAGSMAVGLLLAYGAKADLLALLGLQLGVPWLGVVITGLAISRGSNFMHDLIGSVSEIYQAKKNPPLLEPVLTVTANQISNGDISKIASAAAEKINPTAQEATHI